MAAPWRRQHTVNNSRVVAVLPRRRLAARRLPGHSDCWSHAAAIGSGLKPLFLEELPMSDAVKFGFVPFSTAPRGILVVFCDDALKFGPTTRKALGATDNLVKRAAATSQFKGKSGSTLDILAPDGIKIQILIVLGDGKLSDLTVKDFLKFGGTAAGKLRPG